MNIAISGASGFIGKHLTEYLTERGHRIVPLGRPMSVSYTHLTNAAVRINFPKAQIGVTSVQFIVKSGSGDGQGFAACAEMEFYKKNPGAFEDVYKRQPLRWRSLQLTLKVTQGPVTLLSLPMRIIGRHGLIRTGVRLLSTEVH